MKAFPSRVTLLATGTALAFLLPPLLAAFSPPRLDLGAILNGNDPDGAFILYHLRLPRHVLAFVIGAALSVAGASFQALLKNPLADPYILGVSGGAAMGYVVAIVAGVPFVLTPAFGFAFALAALTLIYALAKSGGTIHAVSLLLTGVIFNSFSFAIILLVNAVVPFGQSQQILFLLLGSVEPVSWGQLAALSAFIAVALAVLCSRAARLNLMSLGDEEAFHMGVDVAREKKIVFVATSLLVGASVSTCGLIGFVGLFVPHLTRLVCGADHRRLLPACALGGGIFLTASDFLAGHVLMWESLETRLPVGVVTALVGAPIFAWLLRRRNAPV
jgi:iron complex transport system permease protein